MQQRPETTFKVGNARASVFKHTNSNRQSGETWESYSVHVHRRYEDSPGVWKSTSYFRFFELPQVAMVLQLATQYVADREAETVHEQSSPSHQAVDPPADETTSSDENQGYGVDAA